MDLVPRTGPLDRRGLTGPVEICGYALLVAADLMSSRAMWA